MSALAKSTAPGPTGEAELSQAELDRVISIAGKLTGIVLNAQKHTMIKARLSRRLRVLGIPEFKSYLDFLESPDGAGEIEAFINAVTTNLTSFFREGHHFAHLETQVLAPLAKSGRSRVRIWSSACSTGEEPYSIAMTALGSSHYAKSWDFKILATDLNTDTIAHGAAGIYSGDRCEAIPERYQKFARAQGQQFQMAKELRDTIAFRRLNLLEPWPFKGPFDAIFCRNVMIYFDAPTKAWLLERFAELLEPGGVLYLGHSESLLGEHPLLARDGQTAYRRRP
ncbi:MAG: protein-glutamate O-methyltransferase [Pseudomonadota bacterium]